MLLFIFCLAQTHTHSHTYALHIIIIIENMHIHRHFISANIHTHTHTPEHSYHFVGLYCALRSIPCRFFRLRQRIFAWVYGASIENSHFTESDQGMFYLFHLVIFVASHSNVHTAETFCEYWYGDTLKIKCFNRI